MTWKRDLRPWTLAAVVLFTVGCIGCGDDAEGLDPRLAPGRLAAQDSQLQQPALTEARLRVDGTRLRDARGRELLLRGVNAGGRSKLPPFFPFPFAESERPEQAGAPPFDDAARAYLQRPLAWGATLLRLPFSWEAVEPERGSYDAVFVERYARLAELAGELGMRVLVDFHQDVFARPFCGDGFPLWAVPEPIPERPEDCTQWFNAYLNPGPSRDAFDRFWANEDGLQDAFEAMWRHMAARLWSVPGVIGFEIINEPGEGNADPATWSEETLPAFYARLAEVIQAAAPGAPVFFDATGVSATTQQTELRLPEGEDLIFAPHYYDPRAFLGFDFTLSPPASEEPLGRWRALGDRWNVPVLVGEFGIRQANGGADLYVRDNFDALDAHLLHGTAWEYSTTVDDWNEEGMSFVGPDGEERPGTPELVRAYPAAVAGELRRFDFDAVARSGTLELSAEAEGVTEIVAPARLYPSGLEVSAEGLDARVRYLPDAGVLLVAFAGAGEVTLRFIPAE